jgi:alkane 1-monooxygenase
MMGLALIPSGWRRVMDPKVVDWAGGDMTKVNMDPAHKEAYFAKYHKVETEEVVAAAA